MAVESTTRGASVRHSLVEPGAAAPVKSSSDSGAEPAGSPGRTSRSGPLRKNLKFLVVGIYFGIVLIKGQVISWYRIQEMFHFQSFFMFGVLGSAIFVGLTSVLLMKRLKLRSFGGKELDLRPKPFNKVANISGGLIFGFGWALTGACPGPLYALLGAGYPAVLVAVAGALLGTLAYGNLRPRLPH